MGYLVVDIGTSGCRAAVVDAAGRIGPLARVPLRLGGQRPPKAEADCEAVWGAVRQAMAQAASRHRGHKVAAVGVSAVLAYVFLGAGDRPLAPALLYADNRAAAEARRIGKALPAEALRRRTGRRPTAECLAAKLMWLHRRRPGLARRLRRVIGLKDEIVRRLTGRVVTDLAHADYSLLFDVARGRFDEALMRELGVGGPGRFPTPVFADTVAGGLKPAIANELGLAAGTPVVVGTSDGTSAMYGGGIGDRGTAVLVSGTTDVLMTMAEAWPEAAGPALSINSGPRPGTFLVGGATGLSGGAVAAFERLLGTGLAGLADAVAALPPGADGLTVVPGLSGERAPFWRPQARGALFGLTPHHGPAHLMRALVEGTGFRLRRLVTELSACGLRPEKVRVTGGMAALAAVNRIRAEAAGVTMVKMAQLEATCLGTAAFCRSALMGGGRTLEICRRWAREAERFAPRPETAGTWERLAARFESCLAAAEIPFEKENDACKTRTKRR